MLYKNRAWRQVSVNHGFFAVGMRFMKLAQCPHRAPGEDQSGACIPRVVGSPFLNAGCHRVGYRKEFNLARVTGRILKRVYDARRPVVLLQPVQRFPFALRLLQCLRVIVGRKVVEMKFHPILPGGMGRVVDAMKPLVARRQERQTGVIGHSL